MNALAASFYTTKIFSLTPHFNAVTDTSKLRNYFKLRNHPKNESLASSVICNNIHKCLFKQLMEIPHTCG